MTSDIDTSIINNSCVQQIDQRRQIIHHLALLLHAHKCLQRERLAITNGDNHETTSQSLCTVPHCTTMRTVLQHMTKCADFKSCSCKSALHSSTVIYLCFFQLPIVFNLVI